MGELSRIMVMDRTTLLRASKPLPRDGLVSSAPKRADSRQPAFTISPTGLPKIEETRPLWHAAQQEYEAQIETERASRLRQDLLSSPRRPDLHRLTTCHRSLNVVEQNFDAF